MANKLASVPNFWYYLCQIFTESPNIWSAGQGVAWGLLFTALYGLTNHIRQWIAVSSWNAIHIILYLLVCIYICQENSNKYINAIMVIAMCMIIKTLWQQQQWWSWSHLQIMDMKIRQLMVLVKINQWKSRYKNYTFL